MVAGIEPARDSDTSTTLLDQKLYTNHTPETACEELFDTFRTHPEQNHDTFLQLVCEIYVKWSELPASVRKAMAEWDTLPEHVRKGIETLLGDTDEG